MGDTVVRAVEISLGEYLLVEVENSVSLPSALVVRKSRESSGNLPPDAREVAAADKIDDASALLSKQIEGLGALAREAIAKASPTEIAIEAHLKFSGGVNVIPFFANASGEGGLKLTLKWTKPK